MLFGLPGEDGGEEGSSAVSDVEPDRRDGRLVKEAGRRQLPHGADRLGQQVRAEVRVLARPPRAPQEGEREAEGGPRADARQAEGRFARRTPAAQHTPGGTQANTHATRQATFLAINRD